MDIIMIMTSVDENYSRDENIPLPKVRMELFDFYGRDMDTGRMRLRSRYSIYHEKCYEINMFQYICILKQ